MAFQYSIAQPRISVNFFDAITLLSLTTNLKLALDSGDAASYSSGQKWLDRSGGGYDFFLGVDGSTDTTDPTFNGVSGRNSDLEYWSFDGGDLFRYDSANETWMNAMHKDSALVSWAAWIYFKSGSGALPLFGTLGSSSIGVSLSIPTTQQNFIESNGVTAVSVADNTTVRTNGWEFIGGALNEAANTITFVTGGTSTTKACTYISPSAAAATYTMEIGATGNATAPLIGAGHRFGTLAIWQGTALTSANLVALYNITRQRFNL